MDLVKAYENEPSEKGRECPGPAYRPTREDGVKLKIRSNEKQGPYSELLGCAKKGGSWVQHNGSKSIYFQNKQQSYSAAEYRRFLRQKAEQESISKALFGAYSDEIEDLTSDERDVLARYAFQHEALRVRQPIVWIPRDDIGVSDNEIWRTRELSKFVWISNKGTALDSKVKVVYRQPLPDFSELDLMNL